MATGVQENFGAIVEFTVSNLAIMHNFGAIVEFNLTAPADAGDGSGPLQGAPLRERAGLQGVGVFQGSTLRSGRR